MKIGIIGIGNIGSNLARLIVKAGHEVIITYSRSPEKLIALQKELGSKATVGSINDAVHKVDLTILSIRYSIMNEVGNEMGIIEGKIIVDTNNPYDIKLEKGATAASETLKRLPGVRLVKAFNTLYFSLLQKNSFAKPLTINPVCGDDEQAKEMVKQLIRDIGFEPFDLGGLKNVALQEPDGVFYNKAFTLEEANKMAKKY